MNPSSLHSGVLMGSILWYRNCVVNDSCWEVLRVVALLCPDDSILPWSSLTSGSYRLQQWPLSLRGGDVRQMSHCGRAHHRLLVSACRPVSSFCLNYHPLHKETSLMKYLSCIKIQIRGQFDAMSIYQNNSKLLLWFFVTFTAPGMCFLRWSGLKSNLKGVGYPNTCLPLLHPWTHLGTLVIVAAHRYSSWVRLLMTFLHQQITMPLLVLWKLLVCGPSSATFLRAGGRWGTHIIHEVYFPEVHEFVEIMLFLKCNLKKINLFNVHWAFICIYVC